MMTRIIDTVDLERLVGTFIRSPNTNEIKITVLSRDVAPGGTYSKVTWKVEVAQEQSFEYITQQYSQLD
jgi:hypothetical protein